MTNITKNWLNSNGSHINTGTHFMQHEISEFTKDMAGNDFVCPLNELRDPKSISDAELENCVEDAVVGRYAGQLKIVDQAH